MLMNPNLRFQKKVWSSLKKAEIAINIPMAEGDEERSTLINSALERYIVSQCNLSDISSDKVTLEEALLKFDQDFESFKPNFRIRHNNGNFL